MLPRIPRNTYSFPLILTIQMNLLQSQRARAIGLIQKKLSEQTAQILDYQIDDYLREVFKLPERPPNTLPYVGWMIEEKKSKNKPRSTSRDGVIFIKHHEGVALKAYMCPGNVLTIGYGHTKNVSPGQKITLQQATEYLKEDLQYFEKAVNDYVVAPLTQNQFDALVSFAFNVGVSAFANSTLLRKLNEGDYTGAANEFSRWVHGGNQKLPGLVRRRIEERKMFLTP